MSGQIKHKFEETVLSESYLAEFLETSLPNPDLCGLTCVNLQRVWCLLRDAAQVLTTKIAKKPLSFLHEMEQRALVMPMRSLQEAIVACCDLTAERASAAIEFLSIKPSDTKSMFDEGFWSRPIVLLEDQQVAFVLTSIEVGSPIRRLEHWLARAGFSDDLSDAKRGEGFERMVRREICSAIEENETLSNSFCYPSDICRDNDGDEQVDLLIKLNNTIVLGEVKCWIGPAEAIEYYSYLKKLSNASEQVARKARWLRQNMKEVFGRLNITLQPNVDLRVLPIVVTNQGYGFSLEFGEVRVVDFHYLRLYLSESQFLTGMAFDAARRTAVQFQEKLYSSEADAEHNVKSAMSKPLPLLRNISMRWSGLRPGYLSVADEICVL